MLSLLRISVLTLGLISFSSSANTLITAENLDRLYQSYAALQQLEQQKVDAEQDDKMFQLAAHCNWEKHYQSFIENDTIQAEELQAYEALVKAHGFRSGSEYLELSMKVMSLSFAAWDAHLTAQNITPDPTTELGKNMLQMQQLHKNISACLSDADKAALSRYEAKILELTQMMAEEDDNPDDIETLDEATQYDIGDEPESY